MSIRMYRTRSYGLLQFIETETQTLLYMNGSYIMKLNHTALLLAEAAAQGLSLDEAYREVRKHYAVRKPRVEEDYSKMKRLLRDVASGKPSRLAHYVEPGTVELEAPLRADVALTWGIKESLGRHLKKEDWERCIELLYEAGVPHVHFTGGEPALRRDLSHLISYTASFSMLTGLSTTRPMSDAEVEELQSRGLGYMQFVACPGKPVEGYSDMDGALRTAEAASGCGLPFILCLNLTADNYSMLQEAVRLAEKHVRYITYMNWPYRPVSLPEAEIAEALQGAMGDDQSLVRHPVELLPVEESVGMDRSESGAGRTCVFILPDGRVKPGRHSPAAVGSLLEMPWNMIWYSHELRSARERTRAEYPLYPGITL